MDTGLTASVTFFFADPGDGLLLWEQHPGAMQAALPRFRDVLQQAVTSHGGEVFNYFNDTLQAAFPSAPGALNAALQAQRALLATVWELPIRPRMALLTGSAQRLGDGYYGAAPHRAARLLSVAHGGQVLLCHITADLARDDLHEDTSLLDLGEHHLPDLTHPEQLFQLTAPGLPDDFPPLKSLNNLDTNLPSQPNALVGREQELHVLTQMLCSKDARLVTLTGIGGTGKTRLALQAAADALAFFQDGVFFAPLDQIADPDLVASAIAEALSLELTGSQSVEDELKAHLRGQRVLLVLDNFEHLLPAATMVSALLAACPKLKVLATSREALRLRGEREFPLNPLPLPDPKLLPPLGQLSQFAAVTLFLQRAQAARPDFKVDNTTAPAVAEICNFLGGLPLAIELAAARLRVFTPQTLLARLKEQMGLQFLSGGARDLPERQQTLHNTLEWSYHLLSPDEQALFRRLGVFAGGFTPEAAESICYLGDSPSGDTFELLSALVEKSLVRQSDDGGEEARFSLLYILRQYAQGLLEREGELAAVHDAHADYYLALSEQAMPELKTNNRTLWINVLDREHDNLRSAISWAISNQKVETGLRLAGPLWRFWWHGPYLREGMNWLKQVLALKGIQNAPASQIVEALKGAAALAVFQGDFTSGSTYGEQALKVSRESGDRQLIADTTGNLGYDLVQQGETEYGAQLLEESIALSREIGNPRGLAIALNKRAILAMDQDNFSLAGQLLQECLSLVRGTQDREGISHATGSLGLLELYQGNYESAKNYFEESYSIDLSLGQQISAMEELMWIGIVLLLQGNVLAARGYFEQSLKAFVQFGVKRGIAENLEGLAGVAGATGNTERAVRLFSAAQALREEMGLPLPPSDRKLYDHVMAGVWSRLSEDVINRSQSEGRQMLSEGLEKIIDYAIEPEPASAKPAGKESPSGLTVREAETLRLLAQGLTDAQIAQKLVISPRTVNAHLTSIYSKLGVNSRAAATRFAVENGLA